MCDGKLELVREREFNFIQKVVTKFKNAAKIVSKLKLKMSQNINEMSKKV